MFHFTQSEHVCKRFNLWYIAPYMWKDYQRLEFAKNAFIVEQGMNRTDENIDPFKVDPPG